MSEYDEMFKDAKVDDGIRSCTKGWDKVPEPPKFRWLYKDRDCVVQLSSEYYSDITAAQKGIQGSVMHLIPETKTLQGENVC